MDALTRVNRYIDSLKIVEFDYAGDYADVWMHGGRTPVVADYDGLDAARAKTIRRTIQALVPGIPDWKAR